MNLPLVSTVIPTFNRAAYVGRAIDSVLAQTYPSQDVIVVDDGSTDDTAEVIETRYGRDERVRYFRQENQGVSAARNTGISAARGEFLALLDSDDAWYPRKIELQVGVLQALPQAGMVWTDMEAIDADGEISDRKYLRKMYAAYKWFEDNGLFTESALLSELLPGADDVTDGVTVSSGEIFSQMLMGNLVHTSTVLLRRERLDAVGGFDVDLRRAGEDYDFHLRTCREGPVAFIDFPSVRYQRDFEDQITQPHNDIHFARAYLNTITRTLDRDRARIELPQPMISGALSGAHSWVGEAALDCGELRDARRHLASSLRYDPLQFRTGALLLLSLPPLGLGNHLRSGYRYLKSTLTNSSTHSTETTERTVGTVDPPRLR